MNPIAEIRLYDVGQGDPYCTDHGFAFYEPLSQGVQAGSQSADSNGTPLLRYIEGIGLVCRESVDPQDTLKDSYLLTGGAWENRRPLTGKERSLRLVQYSTAADSRWQAESTFTIPENPQIAFSLALAETPPDNDGAGYPPYARCEFGVDGNGRYAVDVWPGVGARLLYSPEGGDWQVLRELSGGEGEPGRERAFLLRCARGKIAISTDGGREWAVYADPTGASITVPAGKVIFCGQGGAAAFGLHRLTYTEGVFTSSLHQTFEARTLPTATLTPSQHLPAGTAITLADNSDPGAALAGYTATLTPYEEFAAPWYHWRSPELYAVGFRYPVVVTVPALTYTTPWAGMVVGVEVDKPFALEEGSCTITIQRDASLPWVGNLRNRRIAVRLGYEYADHSTALVTVFTGHVLDATLALDDFGRATIQLHLVNVADWLKRAEWTLMDSAPLGGQALNAANDAILLSEGLGASYRSWHAAGATFPLPAGAPEDPFAWPPPGERKWETLTRLNGYAGLAVAVSDDGVLLTGPMSYVAPLVSRDVTAAGQGDLAEMAQTLTNRSDYGESVTGVIVSGSGAGGGLAATAFDTEAERNPAAARFCGRRIVAQEQVSGSATPGLLAARAGALAGELFPVKQEPDYVTGVDLDRQRRDRIRLYGAAGAGISDGTEAVVLSLRHTFRIDPERGGVELATRAGVRIL